MRSHPPSRPFLCFLVLTFRPCIIPCPSCVHEEKSATNVSQHSTPRSCTRCAALQTIRLWMPFTPRLLPRAARSTRWCLCRLRPAPTPPSLQARLLALFPFSFVRCGSLCPLPHLVHVLQMRCLSWRPLLLPRSPSSSRWYCSPAWPTTLGSVLGGSSLLLTHVHACILSFLPRGESQKKKKPSHTRSPLDPLSGPFSSGALVPFPGGQFRVEGSFSGAFPLVLAGGTLPAVITVSGLGLSPRTASFRFVEPASAQVLVSTALLFVFLVRVCRLSCLIRFPVACRTVPRHPRTLQCKCFPS